MATGTISVPFTGITQISGTNYAINYTTLGKVCVASITIDYDGLNDDITVTGLPTPNGNLVFLARNNADSKRVDIVFTKSGNNVIISFYRANHAPVSGESYVGQVAYITT